MRLDAVETRLPSTILALVCEAQIDPLPTGRTTQVAIVDLVGRRRRLQLGAQSGCGTSATRTTEVGSHEPVWVAEQHAHLTQLTVLVLRGSADAHWHIKACGAFSGASMEACEDHGVCVFVSVKQCALGRAHIQPRKRKARLTSKLTIVGAMSDGRKGHGVDYTRASVTHNVLDAGGTHEPFAAPVCSHKISLGRGKNVHAHAMYRALVYARRYRYLLYSCRERFGPPPLSKSHFLQAISKRKPFSPPKQRDATQCKMFCKRCSGSCSGYTYAIPIGIPTR